MGFGSTSRYPGARTPCRTPAFRRHRTSSGMGVRTAPDRCKEARRTLFGRASPLEPANREVEARGRGEVVPALADDAVGADQEGRRRLLDAEAAGERAVVGKDGDRRIELPGVRVV